MIGLPAILAAIQGLAALEPVVLNMVRDFKSNASATDQAAVDAELAKLSQQRKDTWAAADANLDRLAAQG